jgi:hypothetical protein
MSNNKVYGIERMNVEFGICSIDNVLYKTKEQVEEVLEKEQAIADFNAYWAERCEKCSKYDQTCTRYTINDMFKYEDENCCGNIIIQLADTILNIKEFELK